MNTPRTKKPKRFDLEAWKAAYWKNLPTRNGRFGLALAHRDAAIQFALMVTEFTHLEHRMEDLAASIFATERGTASHIMRSIVSAKARIEVVKAVLERARHNSDKPQEIDEIIDEFWALNRIRNTYVHAQYQTNEDTGEVTWIRPQSDPTLLDDAAYEPFDPAQLEQARNRISGLFLKIADALAVAAEKAQREA